MNWYKFLTETNKIHNDERPPDRLPMFQLVLREQGPLFKTVDKVICWINHLSLFPKKKGNAIFEIK
jgi:hypothetical protein